MRLYTTSFSYSQVDKLFINTTKTKWKAYSYVTLNWKKNIFLSQFFMVSFVSVSLSISLPGPFSPLGKLNLKSFSQLIIIRVWLPKSVGRKTFSKQIVFIFNQLFFLYSWRIKSGLWVLYFKKSNSEVNVRPRLI